MQQIFIYLFAFGQEYYFILCLIQKVEENQKPRVSQKTQLFLE